MVGGQFEEEAGAQGCSAWGGGNLIEGMTSKQSRGRLRTGRQATVRECALGGSIYKDKGLETEEKWLVSLKILVASRVADTS